MSVRYDVIVIGAGHNGLVTAAYLARACRRVLVLERRELVGGACVTEELWPGFKVSTAAYVTSLLRPEITRELGLERHGLQLLPRNPSSFTPFRELPSFRGLPGTQAGPQYRGTIHIAPSMDFLEEAYDDVKYDRPSRSPVIEVTIPSVVDSTIAPKGLHVMSMFTQYFPYRVREGSLEEAKEAYADRRFEIMTEYALNFRRSVIARQVLAPRDIEERFGLTGGNIFQGAMTLDQLFFLRPVPRYADYRTPIQGLYLCGAATHPGGGSWGRAATTQHGKSFATPSDADDGCAFPA